MNNARFPGLSLSSNIMQPVSKNEKNFERVQRQEKAKINKNHSSRAPLHRFFVRNFLLPFSMKGTKKRGSEQRPPTRPSGAVGKK
jgi:hypothetical protein